MNAKLIIDGKEFDIEILDPKLQELIAPKKKTGYEIVELEEDYYYVEADGVVTSSHKYTTHDDTYLRAVDNCYSSITVAINNARADKLMRQLRRFAVEHRKEKLNWENEQQVKYRIFYNHHIKACHIDNNQCIQMLGTVCFDTKESAQLAIDTFHDELVWYFTEYQDSL